MSCQILITPYSFSHIDIEAIQQVIPEGPTIISLLLMNEYFIQFKIFISTLTYFLN